MKVIVSFDFDDEMRESISRYVTSRYAQKTPKLATRAMLRDFIDEAMNNQYISVDDELGLDKNKEGDDD